MGIALAGRVKQIHKKYLLCAGNQEVVPESAEAKVQYQGQQRSLD